MRTHEKVLPTLQQM